MGSLRTDGLESIYDSDTLPQNQESPEVLLQVTNECERLPPTTSAETDPRETSEVLNNVNDKALLDSPNTKYVATLSTSASKKWDVISKKNLKPRKHGLIANVPNKSLFDELTLAKLELVQIQKRFLEAEIAVKKKVWEFEENERKKEAEFKQKEREFKEKEWKWKEEEYKLRYNFK